MPGAIPCNDLQHSSIAGKFPADLRMLLIGLEENREQNRTGSLAKHSTLCVQFAQGAKGAGPSIFRLCCPPSRSFLIMICCGKQSLDAPARQTIDQLAKDFGEWHAGCPSRNQCPLRWRKIDTRRYVQMIPQRSSQITVPGFCVDCLLVMVPR